MNDELTVVVLREACKLRMQYHVPGTWYITRDAIFKGSRGQGHDES